MPSTDTVQRKPKYLGNKSSPTTKDLDTIALQRLTHTITYTSDELTAVCPVTQQPDLYTVSITLWETMHAIESKSLKLYLGSFRNEGVFAEDLASEIATTVYDYVKAPVDVVLKQKIRGGITITTEARVPNMKERYEGSE